MDNFISFPRQEFIEAARNQALTTSRPLSELESEELSWARLNPAGRAEVPEKDLLILWNFDVGRFQLKPEHVEDLRKFLGLSLQLGPSASDFQFMVIGHASQSGANQENQRLALARAATVQRFLQQLGYRYVSIESRGASEPLSRGSDGLALARNRRVEINKTGSPPQSEPLAVPEFFVPGVKMNWIEVPEVTDNTIPLGVAFESPLAKSFGPWLIGEVLVSLKLEGKLKLKISTPGSKTTVAAILKDGKWSAAIDKEVKEGIKAKFTFDPAGLENTGKAPIKTGFQFEKLPGKPEFGVQLSNQPVYISFTVIAIPLGTFMSYGSEVSLEFTGKIKFELGPGPELAAEIAKFITPVAEGVGAITGPVVAGVGALGIALLIQAGTIGAIAWAEEEGVRKCQILAARDVFASRVAIELSGNAAMAELKARIAQWSHSRDKRICQAAYKGYNLANQSLKSLTTDQLTQYLNKWKIRYGRRSDGVEDLNFTTVRERIFIALGGYDFINLEPSLSIL